MISDDLVSVIEEFNPGVVSAFFPRIKPKYISVITGRYYIKYKYHILLDYILEFLTQKELGFCCLLNEGRNYRYDRDKFKRKIKTPVFRVSGLSFTGTKSRES